MVFQATQVIYMPRPSQLEGIWVDRRTTRFDVTLSHEHYPFDEQTLELCVTRKPKALVQGVAPQFAKLVHN
jgi:hypothetical protein